MIAIKPHHFVDIVTACGDEHAVFEPHPRGHAVHTVAHEILANLEVVLRIELGADAICLPCRHNIQGECDDTIDISFRPQAPMSKREYNLIIDQRWAQRLGVRQDDQLTARDFCLRIRDCADNIDDIYRETPTERTAVRHARLLRGLVVLLGEA